MTENGHGPLPPVDYSKDTVSFQDEQELRKKQLELNALEKAAKTLEESGVDASAVWKKYFSLWNSMNEVARKNAGEQGKAVAELAKLKSDIEDTKRKRNANLNTGEATILTSMIQTMEKRVAELETKDKRYVKQAEEVQGPAEKDKARRDQESLQRSADRTKEAKTIADKIIKINEELSVLYPTYVPENGDLVTQSAVRNLEKQKEDLMNMMGDVAREQLSQDSQGKDEYDRVMAQKGREQIELVKKIKAKQGEITQSESENVSWRTDLLRQEQSGLEQELVRLIKEKASIESNTEGLDYRDMGEALPLKDRLAHRVRENFAVKGFFSLVEKGKQQVQKIKEKFAGFMQKLRAEDQKSVEDAAKAREFVNQKVGAVFTENPEKAAEKLQALESKLGALKDKRKEEVEPYLNSAGTVSSDDETRDAIAAKQMTAEDVANLRAEIDIQIREVESEIAKISGQGGGGERGNVEKLKIAGENIADLVAQKNKELDDWRDDRNREFDQWAEAGTRDMMNWLREQLKGKYAQEALNFVERAVSRKKNRDALAVVGMQYLARTLTGATGLAAVTGIAVPFKVGSEVYNFVKGDKQAVLAEKYQRLAVDREDRRAEESNKRQGILGKILGLAEKVGDVVLLWEKAGNRVALGPNKKLSEVSGVVEKYVSGEVSFDSIQQWLDTDFSVDKFAGRQVDNQPVYDAKQARAKLEELSGMLEKLIDIQLIGGEVSKTMLQKMIGWDIHQYSEFWESSDNRKAMIQKLLLVAGPLLNANNLPTGVVESPAIQKLKRMMAREAKTSIEGVVDIGESGAGEEERAFVLDPEYLDRRAGELFGRTVVVDVLSMVGRAGLFDIAHDQEKYQRFFGAGQGESPSSLPIESSNATTETSGGQVGSGRTAAEAVRNAGNAVRNEITESGATEQAGQGADIGGVSENTGIGGVRTETLPGREAIQIDSNSANNPQISLTENIARQAEMAGIPLRDPVILAASRISRLTEGGDFSSQELAFLNRNYLSAVDMQADIASNGQLGLEWYNTARDSISALGVPDLGSTAEQTEAWFRALPLEQQRLVLQVSLYETAQGLGNQVDADIVRIAAENAEALGL